MLRNIDLTHDPGMYLTLAIKCVSVPKESLQELCIFSTMFCVLYIYLFVTY